MSVRAYRRIKMELADDSSFNMWHDNELLDFFEGGGGYHDYRNEDGGGCVEISVELLEKALKEYKWQVIEPLHYPKRGIAGVKYYELEDAIINIISKRLK